MRNAPPSCPRSLVATAARVLSLALPCLASAAAVHAGLPAKPNVVVILLDDFGYGDAGAYGGDLATPGIDALAAQGMRFTQHYALSAVCSPARVGFLTGRYPSDFGIRDILDPGTTERGIPGEVPMLSDVLGDQGYATAHIGKWHMGVMHPEYTPETRFDTWIRASQKTYYDPEVMVDDTSIPRVGHRTQILTDYALAFIDAHADEPFFLNLWYHAPHNPLEPAPEWAAQFPDTNPGKYAALVATVDEQIARITAKIDELGLGPSTLIVLTSDHGAPNVGDNGPLTGHKGELLEGGVRVPFIVRWTGAVAAGTTNEAVSAHFDLFATLAEHLGLDAEALGLDGESLLGPLLLGEEPVRSTPLYLDYQQRFALRDGDWKLRQPLDLIEADAVATPVLHDLATDLAEEDDLADAMPDEVEALLDDYWRFRADASRVPYEVASVEGSASMAGPRFTFDGGRVVLGVSRRFDFHDGDFSMRVTVRPDAIGVQQVLAELPGLWRLELLSDGRARFTLESEIGTTQLTSVTALAAGVDSEVAFTCLGLRFGIQRRRLFVNGQQEDEAGELDLPLSTSDAVALGRDQFGFAPFHGVLRDVAFYSVSLRTAELLPEPPGALPVALTVGVLAGLRQRAQERRGTRHATPPR